MDVAYFSINFLPDMTCIHHATIERILFADFFNVCVIEAGKQGLQLFKRNRIGDPLIGFGAIVFYDQKGGILAKYFSV